MAQPRPCLGIGYPRMSAAGVCGKHGRVLPAPFRSVMSHPDHPPQTSGGSENPLVQHFQAHKGCPTRNNLFA